MCCIWDGDFNVWDGVFSIGMVYLVLGKRMWYLGIVIFVSGIMVGTVGKVEMGMVHVLIVSTIKVADLSDTLVPYVGIYNFGIWLVQKG